MKIGFLHIGRTGGGSLRTALEAGTGSADHKVIWFPHDMTLRQALHQHPDMKIGFVFRDPFERFISAFWGRHRMGHPRNKSQWSAEEAIAFNWFATPNDLAEALSGEDEKSYSAALSAMNAIRHLQRNMAWTLGKPLDLERARDRIHFACSLDQLDERLPSLLASLGMNTVHLSSEHIHVRPDGRSKATELSELGKEALRQFWAADFELFDYCAAQFGGDAGAEIRSKAEQAATEALAVYRSGAHADAVPLSETALRVRPADRTMLLVRARALSNTGNETEGEKAWRTVLELEPENTEALLSMARLQYRRRDLADAADTLALAAQSDPDDTNVRRLRLAVAEAREDFALMARIIDAEALDEAALAQSADWRHAITLRIHQGDLKGAENICRIRLAQDDGGADAVMSLSRVLVLQERFQDLEDLLDETTASGNSVTLAGLVRSALSRNDLKLAEHRLELLTRAFPGTSATPALTDEVWALRQALNQRDPDIERDVHVIALLGVSYCGSTALGSILGSLSGVGHVAESHRMIKSSVQDDFGNANAPFDFERGRTDDLTPCHHCGPECEVYDRKFRQQLKEQPWNWFFRLAGRAGVQKLVTGDKHMALQLDPLRRFDTVILFKSPEAAVLSNLRRNLIGTRGPGHFIDLTTYAEGYVRAYRRFMNATDPARKTLFLNWESFSAAPGKHLQKLCAMLDLPYDPGVLSRRNPVQHAFGGNREVGEGFKAAPDAFSVRGAGQTELNKAQIDEIGQNHPMQEVFAELMERYRHDFT